MWLAARVGVDRRVVVLAACECARTALVYVKMDEKRPRIAIETAERWARGDTTVSLSDVTEAADAAANVANAAAATYAAYVAANAAANAATNAAYVAADVAAEAAANAATYAANAATYAAYAAANAADNVADARTTTLRQFADIVRRHVTIEMIVTAWRVSK